jgi:glycosyltransferase involved in cell wall biosynthesis
LLDLVVVDDCSTDNSLDVANQWLRRHGARFNRVVLVRNLKNSGLGLTRNAGFAAAETPYILPLDADNRIYPRCVEICLAVAGISGAAFVYPRIQRFGEESDVMGGIPFAPMRLSGGNYIDAMALIAKEAWAAAGGYGRSLLGWEDYDFWCTLAERGIWGEPTGEILAEYRVHASSMCQTVTEVPGNKREVLRTISSRHPWLTVAEVQATGERNRLLDETKRRSPAKDRSDTEKRRGGMNELRRAKNKMRLEVKGS